MEKFNGSDDPVFKERAVFIKEERADLVNTTSGAVDRLLQARASREAPGAARAVLDGDEAAGESKKTTDTAVAERLLETSVR